MAEPAPEEGVNELHAAVLTGDAAAVTALLEAGADIESETKYGETTLMVAAKAGDATILDALIKAGATMDKQDKNGKCALMVACGMKKANYTVGHSEVVLQLAKIHKANLDLKDGKGKTALARAAQEGTIAIATNLIKYGAGADLADNDAVTPLMLAAKAKSIDICKLLIEAGANPEAADKKGKDVLKYAGGLKKAGGDLWGVLEAAVAASGGGGGGGKKKKKK